MVKGIQPTEAAKAAIAKIENAVKREVINPSRLVRTPASDLYDKSCYMNTEKFWKDNEIFARVSTRLNEETHLPMISQQEPGYPIPKGHRYYTRDIVDMNYFQYELPFRKMDKLLKEGNLQKYIDKMRKLAKYKENSFG